MQQLEVELKLAVDTATELPDMTTVSGIAALSAPTVHQLCAVYFDTADLRLNRAKITLRCRTGGKDAGWHIKMPTEQGRLEIHHPIEAGTTQDGTVSPAQMLELAVPDAVLAQVRCLVRNQPLIPIARIDNERYEYLLQDADGVALAELCDDHVHTWSYLGAGLEQQWREWEIEATAAALESGSAERLLQDASRTLQSAGAAPSEIPSKLVQALADTVHDAAPAPVYADVPKDSPVGGVLPAIAANYAALLHYDPRVRRDEDDAVHQMRVATRQMRSQFSAFEHLFHTDSLHTTSPREIVQGLGELARMLGRARDAEVVLQRVQDLLAAPHASPISQEAAAPLLSQLLADYQRNHAQAVKALDHPRYLALLDAIEAFLVAPPVSTADASAVVEPMLLMLEQVDRSYQKMAKKYEVAQKAWRQAATQSPADYQADMHIHEDAYHDVRKAMKKLRYVSEATAKAMQDSADAKKLYKTSHIKKLIKATRQGQTLLGEYQDAITCRDVLAKKAQSATRHHSDTLAHGMLIERNHQLRNQAIMELPAAMKKIADAHAKLYKGIRKLEAQSAKAQSKAKKDTKAKSKTKAKPKKK